MNRYKIGFIDEDEQQVNKFERELRDNFEVIGYDIKEGMSMEELLQQVYDSNIDLLMVDYLMNATGILTFNGDEVVRRYEDIKPRFPMIIFTNEEAQAFPHVDNPNIVYEKAIVNKNLAKFNEILRKNIEVYLHYIGKRKDIIDQLLEKSKSASLNGKEKHILTEAQLELLGLDRRANEVPISLLNDNKIDDLEKTARDAEAFLKSLSNEKDNDVASEK